MKKIFNPKILAMVFIIGAFVLTFANPVSAGCSSCDNVRDDGVCTRSGVTKKCVLTTENDEDDDCNKFWSLKQECPTGEIPL